jgi:hypothetical protein
MIGLRALTLEVSVAAEPPRLPSERVPRENHPASLHPAEPLLGVREQMERNSVKSSQPGPLHTQTKHTSANEFHQPWLKKPATVASGKWMMNKTENHHQTLAKLTRSSGTTAAGPSASRSRSGTLEALGGSTTFKAKNSMAGLDGAAMKRKP